MSGDGTAEPSTVESQVTAVASTLETDDDERRVTATGGPIVTAAVTEELTAPSLRASETVAVILSLLIVVFRTTGSSASLGTVTLAPILCAVI
ncbi:hypothetical protein [Natrinema halophilum]|uniref:MMPL family transporter n=1 Tax=Natrinema halophilum TaxID=1699371 RepID=A0A7D5GIR5_9EURY|nr:hypothetical protein [Natrinema halophilum]QLG50094.1 hypothetical protein HYG82_15130 [Natrinema halophilum]